jgi:hypothetical protein
MKDVIAWSYGGGVQSVAIGVMIRAGVLPVPDLAVIADTSREMPTTWEYLREYMQPHLDPIGLKIEIADHSFSRVDLYANDGLTLMPAYTTEGRLSAFCSGKWKAEVIQRWLRSRGVESCTQWIGYSLDELRRAKKDRKAWCKTEYPLIDRMINRVMCEAIIRNAGMPLPSKSRCWCCPHQNIEEWREVRSRPETWKAAVSLEEQINQKDPTGAGLFLYSGRVPLQLATLEKDDGIAPPAHPCETGHCWT